ncbi:MAG: hypothetical protein KatS3mg003_1043 [Candidatus Nitrosocaldaceae archaeon]|nr:MAG: hypothetical protein KatS3mg003_1043 [Candidatus Nitrosocaldaceae archaeon]
MNALEAFEKEIYYQEEEIPRILSDIKSINDDICIFTGAGDSYAAALEAVYVSGHKARFIDPLELSLKPSLAKDSNLYIISISGSTKANIEAAKATKGLCKRIAITANPNSKLAQICDDIIELRYKHLGILTAGSIGFTASLLAAISVISKLEVNDDIKSIFRRAERDADITLKAHIYTIGSYETYPLSIYATAKIYEVLGFKAQYAMLEQFCHMELFSLSNNDTVLLLSDLEKAQELYDKLDCNKYIFKKYNTSMLDNILYYIFLIQLIVLKNAKILGLSDCHFVENEAIRSISSSLIY